MEHDEAPRSIERHVSIQQVGTETLVYDEERHKAFCLNESSSVIWRLANGERTIAQMTTAASTQLRTQVSEEFVLFALEELRREGLIEPSARADVMRTISRRGVLKKLGVGGALLLPVVAALVAPTAAQAYTGCVDCTPTRAVRPRRRRPGGTQPGIAPPGGAPQQ
jgi:hypothetical protein